ncbi:MAG: Spy/CpxP family protein refolding chaperone [Hyphomicrobiales bacterium]|nr:Spy/CpxP family protein refolding chaperone [Hyphomicrobiales bacterium]
MKRYLIAPLAALALGASALALTGAAAPTDQTTTPNAERAQHWAADREAVLDAKLTGMKAGLKLTPDQEKLWGPFETAVRDSQKDRLDEMQKMMEMRHGAERTSPVDLMDAWSNRLMQAATDMKKVVDAAKPLYASLDDTQKHTFATLGHMLLPERARFAQMMHRHWREGAPR